MRKEPPVQANFRASPDLKRRLETAAEAAGLTFNKFVNQKLEAALAASDEQDMTRVPGLLAIAVAMNTTGHSIMSYRAMETGEPSSGEWWNDAYAFEQAVAAANTVLKALRPEGAAVQPAALAAMADYPGSPAVAEAFSRVGIAMTNSVLLEIASDEPTTKIAQSRGPKLKRDLGADLVERIKKFVAGRISK